MQDSRSSHLLHVVRREALSGGVAWVNHHKAADIDTLAASNVERLLELGHRETPLVLLIQGVDHRLSAEGGQACRVQGILRVRDHDLLHQKKKWIFWGKSLKKK